MTDNTEMQIPSDILAAAWACVDHYTDPDLVPVIAMALVREREGATLNEPFTCKFSTTYASYVS